MPKLSTPKLRTLVVVGLATNPLVWVFALFAVHALAICVLTTIFLEACRK